MQSITPMLMFEGQAEAAMSLYLSLFEPSGIVSLTRYGPGEPGDEGTVQLALFSLKGQMFMCIDSSIAHDFTFTPSLSLYVTCESVEEVDRLYEGLSQGGGVLMPLDAYPFSERFAWIVDPFGVSWQLALAPAS